MSTYWEIEAGEVDSERFFEALLTHFPDTTTFYVEGTAISTDVEDFYGSHREEGEYLPRGVTIFPRSKKFRCRFSPSLIAGLCTLARQHAELELLDHLALYKGSEEILSWYDAFANVLLVSRAVPESVVAAFAARLGLGYSRG